MALLSALFAVALLTVIVIEMTDATMVHTHLNRNAGNAMAAQLLARSAATAAEALVADDDANPPERDVPAEPLGDCRCSASRRAPGVVNVQISDEGGKLDLNGAQRRALPRGARERCSRASISTRPWSATWRPGSNPRPTERWQPGEGATIVRSPCPASRGSSR